MPKQPFLALFWAVMPTQRGVAKYEPALNHCPHKVHICQVPSKSLKPVDHWIPKLISGVKEAKCRHHSHGVLITTRRPFAALLAKLECLSNLIFILNSFNNLS